MAPHATVGVISIGAMGLGVARLLAAANFRVLTTLQGRGPATRERAAAAAVEIVPSDAELVARCDYVLSIVPPRDAGETARRVAAAAGSRPAGEQPLYLLDLNAVSPGTAKAIDASVRALAGDTIRMIDGGIIGAPPSLPADTQIPGDAPWRVWKRPGIPLSGPWPLYEAPVSGALLADVLNCRHLGPAVGTASGLKCCFASLTKGLTALSLQSFATAASMGVLLELREYLGVYSPKTGELAAAGIVGCPSKASRWIEEMHQIGQCFEEEGSWGERARILRQVADVYDVLGKAVEERRGTQGMDTPEAVIDVLADSLGNSPNPRA